MCTVSIGLTNLLLIQASKTDKPYWLLGIPYESYRHLDAVVSIRLGGGVLPTQLDTQRFLAAVPDNLSRLVPDPIKRTVWIDSKYVVLTPEVLNYLIVTFGSLKAGSQMPDVVSAMNTITNLRQTSIEVAGLPTSVLLIVELSPLLALAIAYTIYQRVSVLIAQPHVSTVPWLFKDVLRKIDVLVAYVSGSAPLVIVLIISILFADVQGFGVSIPRIANFDIRSVFGLERWGMAMPSVSHRHVIADDMIANIGLVVFLISAWMSFKVMLFLWKITATNCRLVKGISTPNMNTDL